MVLSQTLDVIMLLTSLQQLVFPSPGRFGLLTPCATSLPPPHTNTLPACSPSAVFTFPSTTLRRLIPRKEVRSVKIVWGSRLKTEVLCFEVSLESFFYSSLFLYLCTVSVFTVCVCSRLQIRWNISQQAAFCPLQGDCGDSLSLSAPLASLMMVLIEAVSRIMVGYCFKIPGTEDFIKKTKYPY